MYSTLAQDECSICETSWKSDKQTVTTDCNHTFHRHCAQKRLDEAHKSDCRTCGMQFALINALQKHTATRTTTTNIEIDANNDQSETTKAKEEQSISVPISTIDSYEHDDEVNGWQCIKCSMKNRKSTKRCASCGEPQNAASTESHSTSQTTSFEDTDDDDGDYSARSDDEEDAYLKTNFTVDTTDGESTSSSTIYSHLDSPRSSTTEYLSKSYDAENFRSKATTDSVMRASTIRNESTNRTEASQSEIVYISNLPIDIDDNIKLENRIRHRIEKSLKLKLRDIKCYTKLGVGFICVDNREIKYELINDIGNIVLDPGIGKIVISFVEELELTSYIVLKVIEGKQDTLPTVNEVSDRCINIFKLEKSLLCEKLNIQFPNIYKIVFTSLDEIIRAMHSPDLAINGRFAQIYFCADCSYFEDVPRFVTEAKLQTAIEQEIRQLNASLSCIWVQLNKQTNNACILLTGVARHWSTVSYLPINDRVLLKKTKLTCRLRIYPVPQSFAVKKITEYEEFSGKLNSYTHNGENLILEVSDKTVFDKYVSLEALRVNNDNCFHVEAYNAQINPDECEIDEDTWYDTEMSRYKPDIMQFVKKPEHEIFRYKWNSKIWLKKFSQTALQKNGTKNARDRRDTPSDQTRHRLRVTVMLSTLAAVHKKSYAIGGEQIVELKIDNKMKTIIYDHRSKLEQVGKLTVREGLYANTRIDVTKEDCLVVYENLVKRGYNPLLLNMANATNPGGGYRKGDGAQEENIFRRSDYFRSLDVGLDQWLPERSERFYCSSSCQIDPLSDHNSMYPMHEFGAIYTSRLTVFRQSEDTGYNYMKKPLEGVCSLAMAAYRDPKLDGNMLTSKYAVGTRKKIENIFAIAHHQKHDSLVLSAFGCGAFKNPPGHIAQLFISVIEQYAGFFKLISFAIIDDHNAGHHLNPEGNFKPFKDALDGMVVPRMPPINKPHSMFGPYRILSHDWSINNVCIYDKMPCNFGAKCNDIYDLTHAQEFSHPPICPHAAMKVSCHLTKDSVHMHSFIHRIRCQYGGECRHIDDEKHNQEYEHPLYCPSGGDCRNVKSEHLKDFRHLPLCPNGHKCFEYQKHVSVHCQKYRHCTIDCPHGNHCAYFHDKEHQDKFEHPFAKPCPFTPFHCKAYMELTHTKDRQKLSHDIQQHCLDLAHVCRQGRNCNDKTTLHLEKSVHVARCLCPAGDKCKKVNNEDHLNAYTHPHIPDIRELCEYADQCFDRGKLEHIIKFRHASKFEHSGILSYFNLNAGINFVQNQKRIIENVTAYIQSKKWKPLPSGNIPREIIDWLRFVKPVHRCNPIIFESILLHGHVMSRKYMQHLKNPIFVANSVLQHSRIKRIRGLQERVMADLAREFVIALVREQFEKKNFSPLITTAPILGDLLYPTAAHVDSMAYKKTAKDLEAYFSSVINSNDLDAIRNKAVEIADASINLHMNPSGIGFDKDHDLGTDKTVFSIIGPHLGHYYGDVFIVFKRSILHHPDANFSIQAATAYISGHAFQMRPWLGKDSGLRDENLKLYHGTKLNASVPGYDYATALELMALTSHYYKLKSMDVTLNRILERWVNVDSHINIEGHLPQLIPLSYIDHIFIPKNLYESLSAASHRAINSNFKNRITIIPHDGEANQPGGPRGPKPPTKSRADYQETVIRQLTKQYSEYLKNPPSRSVEGAAITIASTDFTDYYLLPLTISQAYDQYCFAKKHPPPDQITYIYWQVSNGDMMLTLSNQIIESGQKQPRLRCLTCYIAPKPLSSISSYHEQYSYLDNNPPFKHHILKEQGKFAAKSDRFHVGCNTDDFMTFCLEIQRSNGRVTLMHAGPNGVYNHEKISHTFKKAELDLTRLNYVHVSAGSRTVPVRNLMIYFEKQTDLHPTFDKNFKKVSATPREHFPRDKKPHDSSSNDYKASTPKTHNNDDDDDNNGKKTPGVLHQIKDFFFGDDHSSTLIPCRDNVNCLFQFSVHGASDHNAKYSHPCRYSELCRNKESNFTHEFHQVSKCKYDKSCNKLDDPFHRAEYRHTELPDFLVPCRDQCACVNNTNKHRIKYSHGEKVYRTKTTPEKERASSAPKREHGSNALSRCQWGSKCWNIGDRKHCEQFAHSTPGHSEDNIRQASQQHKNPCRYGAKCYSTSSNHRAEYSHPPSEKDDNPIKHSRKPCRYGESCSLISDTSHRAKYSH
ncbi:unnamed protein product [Rotaria socialis]|uniref:Uncharacterized protein n=3 Tax=Rotaria socialis TaxID=392032 RepID=A0A817YRX5_9BILA|nr:unnamed protein product [Rotaria socialis]CAF4629936.1 unnamed protein product [Rotaria socialis]